MQILEQGRFAEIEEHAIEDIKLCEALVYRLNAACQKIQPNLHLKNGEEMGFVGDVTT